MFLVFDAQRILRNKKDIIEISNLDIDRRVIEKADYVFVRDGTRYKVLKGRYEYPPISDYITGDQLAFLLGKYNGR